MGWVFKSQIMSSAMFLLVIAAIIDKTFVIQLGFLALFFLGVILVSFLVYKAMVRHVTPSFEVAPPEEEPEDEPAVPKGIEKG